MTEETFHILIELICTLSGRDLVEISRTKNK